MQATVVPFFLGASLPCQALPLAPLGDAIHVGDAKRTGLAIEELKVCGFELHGTAPCSSCSVIVVSHSTLGENVKTLQSWTLYA